MITIKIDVDLRLPDSKHDKVIAFGTCTLDRRVRFMVQIRKQLHDGKEQWGIQFPKLKKGDEWLNILEFQDRAVIEGAIGKELQKMLLLEQIEEFEIERVRVLNLKLPNVNGAVKPFILADIELIFENYTMKGLALKQYKNDFIVQMPQYVSDKGFRDIVYPLNHDIRQRIRDSAFQSYCNEIENGYDHEGIEDVLEYLKRGDKNG